ncbi:GTP-binding protein [uncultured Roseobacter sp.]|uniref:CobW family GTP-binding protein n=1 Tax=uncultured Roseobacter sp. TaxID=114847 RepID=UPI00261E9199|nr:GTP-binding protein [uncultured Roseobacter sp.]
MNRVPLTVIGGYLGAGKTTLINQLLSADHGQRLAVLVNDFGAVNIDAALLQSADTDTIELTNGCVCCTMSGDLFYSIGDLLDRNPPPDHILVEASGIADPARIAAVSLAEKDLVYAGIITVADGVNLRFCLEDARISDQVRQQLHSADLIAISKTDPADVAPLLRQEGYLHWTSVSDLATICATIFGRTDLSPASAASVPVHPAYVHWSESAPPALSGDAIRTRLASLPVGLLRLKALLTDTGGGGWEVHVVGQQKEIRARPTIASEGIVAIGLKEALSREELRDWWLDT